MEKLIHEIANRIHKEGGQAYFVGGRVRDELYGIVSKDFDVEVFGLKEEQLILILKEFGEVLHYGSSFGIYSLKGYPFDFALPRKEKKIGDGHRDFDVEVDPYLSIEQAAKRRDFTMNSLYQNILSGEIIDCFNGQADLKNKVLKHVDDVSFKEDPLRVLRGAQFASRFALSIDSSTLTIMKDMDLSSLSKERVEEEMKKALLQSDKPSIFFEVLKQCNQLSYWFKEVEALINCEQDPIYHPEGTVYVHTMQVIDEAAKYRSKVNNPYEYMLLSLTHDFGKKTKSFADGDRIHNYDHEKDFTLTNAFEDRLIGDNSIKEYLTNMIPLHMALNTYYRWKHQAYDYYKIYQIAKNPIDLIYFSLADHAIDIETLEKDERYKTMMMYFSQFQDIANKQFIVGRDLVDKGYAPSNKFKQMIDVGNDLALKGMEKEEILKEINQRFKNKE